MIIEAIKGNAIPYQCDNCGCIYTWKPNDASGKCELGSTGHKQCDQDRCRFYAPDEESVRCPVCQDYHSQERMGILRYKILRAIRCAK